MGRKSIARRVWRWGGIAALCAVVVPHASADAAGVPDMRPLKVRHGLRVAPANWGAVDVRDIQVLLEAVAAEVQSIVGAAPDTEFRIRVLPRGGAPRVLYDRGPDGEYLVHLSARNEAWYQYVYQFAHELCHIHSNFDHKERQGDEVAGGNQWFEESVCETASLFALRRLGEVWRAEPPAPRWTGYGPVLTAYADFLLQQDHRRLPADASLAQWYRDNQASLRQSPYQRERNEVVATRLLQVFERAPQHWPAIAHLNADAASAGKEFADYLADWFAACPAEHREVVRETMELFGFAPPLGALAAASATHPAVP